MRSIGIANEAPADVDLERGDDRQRQRQPDLGERSDAERRLHQDLAAEYADLRAHGVHADAAARDVAGRLGRREAGVKEELDRAAACRLWLPASASIRPCSAALRATALRGRSPRPSSRTSMTTLPPAWRAAIVSVPIAGLPAATRSSGRLEAVIERVAHEMDERVAERVDDRAVELGVAAEQLQLDLLAELRREVAYEAREAHEDDIDRDHPHLHDHRLQRLRAAREVLDGVVQLRRVDVRGVSLDGRAVDRRARPSDA